MPIKATYETVDKKDKYNCPVCKDTGVVYFVLESSFWGKKRVRTVEPQICYSCQPKT